MGQASTEFNLYKPPPGKAAAAGAISSSTRPRGVAAQVAFGEASFVKPGFHLIGSRVETIALSSCGATELNLHTAPPPPRNHGQSCAVSPAAHPLARGSASAPEVPEEGGAPSNTDDARTATSTSSPPSSPRTATAAAAVAGGAVVASVGVVEPVEPSSPAAPTAGTLVAADVTLTPPASLLSPPLLLSLPLLPPPEEVGFGFSPPEGPGVTGVGPAKAPSSSILAAGSHDQPPPSHAGQDTSTVPLWPSHLPPTPSPLSDIVPCVPVRSFGDGGTLFWLSTFFWGGKEKKKLSCIGNHAFLCLLNAAF
jgi:hypothetical protein